MDVTSTSSLELLGITAERLAGHATVDRPAICS
jgi:hypothetical protein